jgi:glycosyltransferase involved in cell wall biosynthesis
VSVGRLVPVKDPRTLLKAFALLRARRAARLALVGDGEMRAELGELAAELGIADDVAFVGFQDNPIRFIARAAALVVTSRHEGFGNVIVEALAAGTPVVSTDCPYGPAEILEDGRYGRLAPIGDAEAIASAMEEVLDAPPQREASLARGWQFTASDIAARYAEALATVGVEGLPDTVRSG